MPSVRTDLEQLVRIRSVSADPDHAEDVRASADAVARLAWAAGASEVDVVNANGGAPAVIARWPAPPGMPTVLLYAHHDVQPVGLAADWSSDPFEPAERSGRLYGRGAADDKAGIAAHLAALRAFEGRPPVGVVLFVEGEEEIGSPTFAPFLQTYRDRLSADVILVADSTTWTVDTPALTTSLRGLVDCYVEVQVLERAVHSGIFGGPVIDALTLLCRLLATLHDDHGDVAIPGLTSKRPSTVDYSPQRYRTEAGVRDSVTLSGTGPLADRLWAKPAISVLGIDAPTVGEAANVLVHKAKAKVSMRLPPDQAPGPALQALSAHLRDNVEFGAQVEVVNGAQGAGTELDSSSWVFSVARSALSAAFGHDVVTIGAGGSIPCVAEFEQVFPDTPVLITGAADPDCRAHGVDESLHLDVFAKYCLAEALFLDHLARTARNG
jgi:acetylornithine deacetylase/succinyl-diaminopimelate desuccinylase-like protein